MNTLQGTISNVQSEGPISLVTVDCKGVLLSALVVEKPEQASHLRVGQPMGLVFKEINVILLPKDALGNSMPNRIAATIINTEPMELLTRVRLDTPCGPLTAVIPTGSFAVKTGEQVLAQIKTNEIMLSTDV